MVLICIVTLLFKYTTLCDTFLIFLLQICVVVLITVQSILTKTKIQS